MKKAIILDYGVGNIKSLKNLLEKLNYNACLSNKRRLIDNCDLIVLPGVGKYNKAISNLKKNNLFNYMKKKLQKMQFLQLAFVLACNCYLKIQRRT